ARAAPRPPPREDGVEDVAERPEPATKALEATRAGPVHSAVAEHVVCGPALPVGQHPIRLVQLLKAGLGAVGGVDIGMVALGGATIGALDLLIGGVALDAQHLVVVPLGGHRARII